MEEHRLRRCVINKSFLKLFQNMEKADGVTTHHLDSTANQEKERSRNVSKSLHTHFLEAGL